jgi:hypothetical protein
MEFKELAIKFRELKEKRRVKSKSPPYLVGRRRKVERKLPNLLSKVKMRVRKYF